MTENAIVVITYNRLVSLKRLIRSLLDAEYLGDKIDLIVSMDCSGDENLKLYIESISWPFGEIVKIFHEERLGLKKHVLFCGSLTDKYENLFVFEDDLYVSKSFYLFGKKAIKYYKNDKNIAGISLYTYQWNQYVNKSFTPLSDENDIFFMQVASSWGQVWMKESWKNFIKWMENKSSDDLKKMDDLPKAVSNWSSHSWLKFHHAYLASENKFFVYPRVALSTNFSEPGQHAYLDSTYQVELQHKLKTNYKFCELKDGIKYDPFYENIDLSNSIDGYKNLIVDLYGSKPISNKYILTTRNLPYHVEKKFALRMRPHELNILNNIHGEGVFLYDASILIEEKKGFIKIFLSTTNNNLFYYKMNNRKVLINMWIYLFLSSMIRKILGFFK
ncbi:glycosyltransferase [Acinetobacter pseudolwoffii]|uniref:glycosyltransferase n=1 Tax=Acinetobacter pseudolwoffii TaxID=2053287 RepID=UPI003988F9A3